MINPMERLSEIDKQKIYEKNNMINTLSELEYSISKAKTLVYDLLDDYNLRDENKTRDKIELEAPRIISFIEISADYINSTFERLVSTRDELQEQVDKIREGGQTQ